MFVLLLFLLCPGANPLNLSAETRYSPILIHTFAAAWPSHTAPHACASAQLPQRLHPGWHAWNAAARAQHRPPASPAGWHAHTYPYLPRIYNIN